MSDQYRNFGKDFPPIIQSQYNVPPPGFPPQSHSGGFEKWDNDSFPSSRNIGYKGNRDDGGSYNREDYGNRASNPRFGSGGNNNKGGFNKGNSNFQSSASNDMITQEDTIFVSGMDPSVSESEIHSHFGAIGIIKKDKKTMKPKIWLYRNKETGLSKGEATVTYDDVNAAQSAISWFDGRDFNGSTIKVSLAQRQNNWNKGGGRKGGFSGGRGGGGGGGNNSGPPSSNSSNDRFNNRNFDRSSNNDGDNYNSRDDRGGSRTNNQNRSIQQRDGDWKCSECSNTNFAWRNECNRCKTPKSSDGGSGGGGGGGGGSGGGSFDRQNFKNSMDNNRGNRGGGGFSRGGSGGGGNRRDGGPMKNNNGTGSRSKPY